MKPQVLIIWSSEITITRKHYFDDCWFKYFEMLNIRSGKKFFQGSSMESYLVVLFPSILSCSGSAEGTPYSLTGINYGVQIPVVDTVRTPLRAVCHRICRYRFHEAVNLRLLRIELSTLPTIDQNLIHWVKVSLSDLLIHRFQSLYNVISFRFYSLLMSIRDKISAATIESSWFLCEKVDQSLFEIAIIDAQIL